MPVPNCARFVLPEKARDDRTKTEFSTFSLDMSSRRIGLR
jgi:hypothetical protein